MNWCASARTASLGFDLEANDTEMNATALQTLLASAVASGIPGIAAAVTNPTGTMFEACAGATTLGGNQPVTPDTLFWIASMTKPLTSLAAMQLVERGKLSLHTPIGEILPQLATPNILRNGALRPATRPITLHQLLTHTSGFTYGFASAELTAWLAANNLAPKPSQRATLDMPLLFEPGERWEYGISTDWVGQAVEAASGETLDVYFNNHITSPLGMENTVFLPTPEQGARRAVLHQREPDGSLRAIPPNPPQRPEFFSGGGGLYSTLSDYLKFTRVFLNGGAGIARPESIAAMGANQIGTLRAGFIPSANPNFTQGSDAFPGMDTKWGYGFVINPDQGPFGRSPGSLAWGGVANTFFWIDPVKEIAAVLMMQVLPAGDMQVMQAAFGFEREVYAALR